MTYINKLYNTTANTQTNAIVNNTIYQLIDNNQFYIKDITTLFEYYDRVKQDISRLDLQYSHQYISDLIINKFPNNIQLINNNVYSYVIQNLNQKIEEDKLLKNGSFKY